MAACSARGQPPRGIPATTARWSLVATQRTVTLGRSPTQDVDVILDGRLDDGRSDTVVDGMAVDDDTSGAGVGSDGSFLDVAGVAEMPAVELGDDYGVVHEWGGTRVHQRKMRTGLLEVCRAILYGTCVVRCPAVYAAVLSIPPRTFDPKLSKGSIFGYSFAYEL